MASQAPAGSTLYDVLAHAVEAHALADPSFAGATQV